MLGKNPICFVVVFNLQHRIFSDRKYFHKINPMLAKLSLVFLYFRKNTKYLFSM